MDKNTYDSLRIIIDYLFKDEQKNYSENPSGTHIYHNLIDVKNWLDETEKDYADLTTHN